MVRSRLVIHWVLTAVALSCCGWFAGAGAGAAAPAGAQVAHQTVARYEWEGARQTSESNRVSAEVRYVPSLAVSPSSRPRAGNPGDAGFEPARETFAAPGQQVVAPFTVTNEGNGPESFTIEAIVPDLVPYPGDADPIDPAVFLDANWDGRIGPGEAPVERIGPLRPQERVSLLVRFGVPPSATVGDTLYARIRIRGVTATDVTHWDSWVRTEVVASDPVLIITRNLAAEAVTVDEPIAPMALSAHAVAPLAWVSPLDASSPGRIVVTHQIEVENVGAGVAEDVVIQDTIGDRAALNSDAFGPEQGLLVNGLPIYHDAVRDPHAVISGKNVSVTFDRLDPGQRVRVSYQTYLEASDVSTMGKSHVAEVTYNSETRTDLRAFSNENAVLLAGEFDLALGPAGNPQALPGGSGSPDDLQADDDVVGGEVVTFVDTVQNTGNVAGVVEFVTEGSLPSGWVARLYQSDGLTPLSDTDGNDVPDVGSVPSGGTRSIVLAVQTPAGSGATEAELISVIARFAARPDVRDETRHRVGAPVDQELVWNPFEMKVEPGGTVVPGNRVRFVLTLGNAHAEAALDVVIMSEVSEHLTDPESISRAVVPLTLNAADGEGGVGPSAVHALDVAATATYDPATRMIVWKIPSFPAGYEGTLSYEALVKDEVPDDAVIRGSAALLSALSAVAHTSNMAVAVLLRPVLDVEISPARETMMPGDRNTYTVTLTNESGTTSLNDIHLHVALPAGLSYMPGSWHVGGTSGEDPDWSGGRASVNASLLSPGQSIMYRFDVYANAAAEGDQVVAVSADARSPHDGVTSARAESRVKVRMGPFSSDGIIVGRVYADLDRDGRYGEGDEAVSKARVYLDNGRFAITDEQGGFHFDRVAPGQRVVRLDGSTVNAAPVFADSATLENPYGKVVRVVPAGMAITDFQLKETGVRMLESVTVHVSRGPVRLERVAAPQGEGMEIVMAVELEAGTSLSGLAIRDGLPAGATRSNPLVEGLDAIKVDFNEHGAVLGDVTGPVRGTITYWTAETQGLEPPYIVWDVGR